jgi:hypothetical protein
MSGEKRIIEVQGVKIEVDTRDITVIDTYRIGQNVKVLIKTYNDWKLFHAVIIGFYPFNNLPTITLAYLDPSYGDEKVKFIALNKDSKDVELCPAAELDLELDKKDILDSMDRKIESIKQDLAKNVMQREFFLQRFDSIFKTPEKELDLAS